MDRGRGAGASISRYDPRDLYSNYGWRKTGGKFINPHPREKARTAAGLLYIHWAGFVWMPGQRINFFDGIAVGSRLSSRQKTMTGRYGKRR